MAAPVGEAAEAEEAAHLRIQRQLIGGGLLRSPGAERDPVLIAESLREQNQNQIQKSAPASTLQ